MDGVPSNQHWQSEIYGILISAASKRAESALTGFRTDDPWLTRMAYDAGAAVEQMAKAFLAAQNPALLLPSGFSHDALLHLTGHGDLASGTLYEIQTIGLGEACRRVGLFLPSFSYDKGRDAAPEFFKANEANGC